jgi:hypothetical protein
MENLKPFIPKMSDSAEEVKTKLAAFRREYINMLNDTNTAYGVDAGYKVNPVVAETLKTGRAKSYVAPEGATGSPRVMKFDAEGNIVP